MVSSGKQLTSDQIKRHLVFVFEIEDGFAFLFMWNEVEEAYP